MVAIPTAMPGLSYLTATTLPMPLPPLAAPPPSAALPYSGSGLPTPEAPARTGAPLPEPSPSSAFCPLGDICYCKRGKHGQFLPGMALRAMWGGPKAYQHAPVYTPLCAASLAL